MPIGSAAPVLGSESPVSALKLAMRKFAYLKKTSAPTPKRTASAHNAFFALLKRAINSAMPQ